MSQTQLRASADSLSLLPLSAYTLTSSVWNRSLLPLLKPTDHPPPKQILIHVQILAMNHISSFSSLSLLSLSSFSLLSFRRISTFVFVSIFKARTGWPTP
ncbi:hypothetical protein NL108_002306 [Boleophthalmus pectinirostris]|nr:hypothetical protein NL108_002306 [Boleophthalmus pectinirostris]